MGAATVVGWREWMCLPLLGIEAIRCKVDSGARSSALHVESCEVFIEGGEERVRFSVRTGVDDAVSICEARVCDRRPVTDSGGNMTERVFIETDLVLGGRRFPIEINLTNRRNMLFPMLLGRTAMAGRFVVDPAASFLLGDRDEPGETTP